MTSFVDYICKRVIGLDLDLPKAPAIVPASNLMPVRKPLLTSRRAFLGGLVAAPALIRAVAYVA